MADVYLALQSDKPGSTLVVLVNGEPSTTGYTIPRSGGVDLGAAVYDRVYSGPRGTQGAKLVGTTAQNRLSTWMLQVAGTSEDDLQAKMSVLWNLDEELRAYGGTAYWRSWGSSFRMELDVLDSGIQVAAFDPDLWVANHRLNVQLGLVTPPYMSGPPMDIADDFSTDTEVNYTFDAGSGSDVLVTGGQLTATANLTTEKRMIHTGVGYSYGDQQVTLKAIPGSTIASFKAGTILKRIDANNYLEAYVDDNAVNSRVRLDKVVAGVRTNLATSNLAARVANGIPFWVRGRVQGNTFSVEYYVNAPTPAQSATTSVIYRFTPAEYALFGGATVGQAGLSWIPQQAAAVLDDFTVEAFTYSSNSGLILPDNLSLFGPVPGDAPALFEAFITPSGGSAAPIWATFGWWAKLPPWNRVWNGDFENTALGTASWSVAAVANINGAGTSITRITTASKYGISSGQVVCPATSGTGASFRVFRPFYQGVTYTAECWIHSAAGVTSTSIRLGNGAGVDSATSVGVALSAAWTRISVSWTPTANVDNAHVALIINAATATTFEIDGVMVYEGTTAPASGNQAEGRGGSPPLGLLEAENAIAGPVANANFRGSFGATTPQVVIDPSLLTPDDSATKTIAVEVWARVELTAATPLTMILSAKPLSTTTGLQSIYSEEYGNVGFSVTLPNAGTHRRMTRLGTLRLPTDGGRFLLTCAGTIDYFVLLPSKGRALSPSGRANDGSFPQFVSATSEITRRIRADLSGTLTEPATGAPESPAPGLGGSLLELPPGNVEAAVKLSTLVPDDPTASANEEQLAHGGSVHFKVTPRWRVGRSS